MTAALGVVLNKDTNTQKFFGGGQVENKSKKVANDTHHHTNDVSSIQVSYDRTLAVSGQVGKFPAVFVWATENQEKK